MRLLLERVPQLQRLAVLEAVGRLGSFTSAAAELGISQPAVSKHISTLETQLGFPLFERRANRIDLTAEGTALHQAITAGFDDLEAALTGLQKATERLVIAAQPSAAQTWLAPRIDEIRSMLAPCEVSLVIFDREDELLHLDYDVVIRSGNREATGHRTQHLIPEVVVPVAAPELAARLGLGADSPPESLLDAPLLHVDRVGRPWMSWSGWFAGNGLLYEEPPDRLLFDTYATLMQQAISGNGVILSWRYLRADLVERGLLVEVGPEVHNPSGGHFLSWPNALHRDHRVRNLRDWLKATLPADMFTAHG